MKIFCTILVNFVLILVCAIRFAEAEEPIKYSEPWAQHILVLAQPISVGKGIDISTSSEVYVGMMFPVKFNVVDVVEGNIKSGSYEVNLFASHREVLTTKQRLYILLEKDGSGFKALSWTEEMRIACFPKSSVEGKAFENDFRLNDDRLSRSCIPL